MNECAMFEPFPSKIKPAGAILSSRTCTGSMRAAPRRIPAVGRGGRPLPAAPPTGYAGHATERNLMCTHVEARDPNLIVHIESEARLLSEYVCAMVDDYRRRGALDHGFLNVCARSVTRIGWPHWMRLPGTEVPVRILRDLCAAEIASGKPTHPLDNVRLPFEAFDGPH
jgi:hypothetical protein